MGTEILFWEFIPYISVGGMGEAEKYELRRDDSLLVLIPESRLAIGSCIDKKSEMLDAVISEGTVPCA